MERAGVRWGVETGVGPGGVGEGAVGLTLDDGARQIGFVEEGVFVDELVVVVVVVVVGVTEVVAEVYEADSCRLW